MCKPEPAPETPLDTSVVACPCWVTVLIGAQMTDEPRTTVKEAVRKSKTPTTVQAVIQRRRDEDRNFRRKATTCEARMKASGRFASQKIIVAATATGEALLSSLESASSWGQIKNLVFWGHSGPYGIYGKEDRGFYRDAAIFPNQTWREGHGSRTPIFETWSGSPRPSSLLRKRWSCSAVARPRGITVLTRFVSRPGLRRIRAAP